jgi:hypothetical protein
VSLHDKRTPHHTNSGRQDEVTRTACAWPPRPARSRAIVAKLRRNVSAGSLLSGLILGDVDGLHASDRQPILVVDSPCSGLAERVRGQLSDQPVQVVSHEDFTNDGQRPLSSTQGDTFHVGTDAIAGGTRLVVVRPSGERRERELQVTLAGCSSDALEVLALALRAELVAGPAPPEPEPEPEPPAAPHPAAQAEPPPPPLPATPPHEHVRVHVYAGARGLRPLPDAWTAGAGLSASLDRWPLRALLGAEVHAPRTLERPAAQLQLAPGVLEAQAGYGVVRWRGGALHAVAGLGATLLGRRTTATAPAYGATARDLLALPHALVGVALGQHGWGRLSVALGVGLRVPLAHRDFVVEDTAGGESRLARTARVAPWLSLDLGLRVRGAAP